MIDIWCELFSSWMYFICFGFYLLYSKLKSVKYFWEVSSTIKQFTSPEIWKPHAILLGIHAGGPNMKISDCLGVSFFQAAVTSILLYGCTTWTLTKRLEKKLDGNYTRMLRAILNKSWQQHPTRHQLYGHLPPITKTIQVRRTRHAGHCWRSRDELIRDVLLWIPTYGRAKAGRPARTYIQQLCEDTGCCPEDLPRAMNDREEWRERVRDIRATSAIWWWWLMKTKRPVHIMPPLILHSPRLDKEAKIKCLEKVVLTWIKRGWLLEDSRFGNSTQH